mgnify:CR=1 FL=1
MCIAVRRRPVCDAQQGRKTVQRYTPSEVAPLLVKYGAMESSPVNVEESTLSEVVMRIR